MTNANLSYVREEMLAPQDPPLGQTGVIRWLRENLFSSWLNASIGGPH